MYRPIAGVLDLRRRALQGWQAPVAVGWVAAAPMVADHSVSDLPAGTRKALRDTKIRNVWHSMRGEPLEDSAATFGAWRAERRAPQQVREWPDAAYDAPSPRITPDYPLSLQESIELARAVVQQRFPGAIAAWLGGSVARGDATGTSDLDITVLLDGAPAPLRESVVVDGRPIELFVQTRTSLAGFRLKDQQRRQPSTARLVAESVTVLNRDGVADQLRAECAAEIQHGPKPLSQHEIDTQRYALTDLLGDLEGTTDPGEALIVGARAFELAARLLLGLEGRWQGSGKGLARALRERDDPELSDDLVTGLALIGEIGDGELLIVAADLVLDRCGGRLFEGYTRGGD